MPHTPNPCLGTASPAKRRCLGDQVNSPWAQSILSLAGQYQEDERHPCEFVAEYFGKAATEQLGDLRSKVRAEVQQLLDECGLGDLLPARGVLQSSVLGLLSF